jgi:hypothetical protein
VLPKRFAAIALACLLAHVAIAGGPDERGARQAADRFGQALVRADPSLLRSILPEQGQVQLKLVRLGPEDGFFSASQVEALLRDFLALGQVRSFTTTRVEYDPQGVALVSAQVALDDRDGGAGAVGLHLAFQPEGDAWVLREVRETAR